MSGTEIGRKEPVMGKIVVTEFISPRAAALIKRFPSEILGGRADLMRQEGSIG
jgi:hypothetical protein